MEFILWLLAMIFVIAGIVAVATGGVLYGIALVAVGLLVGPGGVTLFA
ncbi:MAG: GPGG-motif small membrane protein [Acidimicrobiia bacterium]